MNKPKFETPDMTQKNVVIFICLILAFLPKDILKKIENEIDYVTK